jgi:hypothetical protein
LLDETKRDTVVFTFQGFASLLFPLVDNVSLILGRISIFL